MTDQPQEPKPEADKPKAQTLSLGTAKLKMSIPKPPTITTQEK